MGHLRGAEAPLSFSSPSLSKGGGHRGWVVKYGEWGKGDGVHHMKANIPDTRTIFSG